MQILVGRCIVMKGCGFHQVRTSIIMSMRKTLTYFGIKVNHVPLICNIESVISEEALTCAMLEHINI
jgi:hypothetical protein